MIEPMMLYAINIICENKELEIPERFIENLTLFREMLLLGYITVTQTQDGYIVILTELGLSLATSDLQCI